MMFLQDVDETAIKLLIKFCRFKAQFVVFSVQRSPTKKLTHRHPYTKLFTDQSVSALPTGCFLTKAFVGKQNVW